MNKLLLVSLVTSLTIQFFAQSFVFPYPTNGNRVCLVESEVDLSVPNVKINLLDYASNSSHTTDIFRRPLYGTGSDWTIVATALSAGTAQWIDSDVEIGEVWEYQVRRHNTWTFNTQSYDAIGYTIGTVQKDNSEYQGQIIVLIASNIATALPTKIERLKTELTGEGWLVNELVVPAATGWYSGDTVVGIRNQIKTIYSNAPSNDKPKILLILGHVPMPRSGSTLATAPDAHDQNKGARGFDGFYADIDGIYTDTATFNPAGIQTPLAINFPNDFKWDQDYFSSDLEMAFGRIDFRDLTDITQTEIALTSNYLDRLSNYKNVEPGYQMGEKSAFNFGYQNSNDGTFRTLPNISKASQVFQNTSGTNHPQWVQSNGPFKVFMQNQVAPVISEWQSYGMNATVFSSDQSYWGFNDVPQTNAYGRIRAILGLDTKCLVSLWTTTAANVFHQACTGDALGLALKQVMNHSLSNNRLERAPQQWDTEEWWNRTHFSYNGDPSLNLYQVAPVQNVTITTVNGIPQIGWNASPELGVLGYHVYKSTSQFGKYQKLTSSPIQQLNFNDSNYQTNDWYMVRAVKLLESGCGKFIHGSNGKFVKGTFDITKVSEIENNTSIALFPNPNHGTFILKTTNLSFHQSEASIFALDGKELWRKKIENTHESQTSLEIVTNLKPGTYILKLNADGINLHQKFIVE